jgi:hypothetical protein
MRSAMNGPMVPALIRRRVVEPRAPALEERSGVGAFQHLAQLGVGTVTVRFELRTQWMER